MTKPSIFLIAALGLTYGAAVAQPLVFDFMVTGSELIRPKLVFHDGENTYIQPPEDIPASALSIKSADAERYGPYIMVHGIPKTFSMSLKKENVTITYTGKPQVRFPTKEQMTHSAPEYLEVKDEKEVIRPGQVSSCAPKIGRTEFAYLIGTETLVKGVLTKDAYEKLETNIGSPSGIEAIYLRAPSSLSSHSKAVKKALTSMGVSPGRIYHEIGALRIGTEVRVVRSKMMSCYGGLHIAAQHRGSVTVQGRADVYQVLDAIANALGMKAEFEGTKVPIDLSLSEVDKPLVTVLNRISKALNYRADIVLRGDEIVIRYRKNQTP